MNKNNIHDKLLKKYENEIEVHDKTKNELKLLKTKFEGIKQLFSL